MFLALHCLAVATSDCLTRTQPATKVNFTMNSHELEFTDKLHKLIGVIEFTRSSDVTCVDVIKLNRCFQWARYFEKVLSNICFHSRGFLQLQKISP